MHALQTPAVFLPPAKSIFDQIASHAKNYPKQAAIIPTNQSIPELTFQDLATTMVQSLLWWTHKLGLSAGDTIALLMENEPELLIVNWTAWSFGFRTVPLDSKRDDIERKIYKLHLTQAKILLARTDQVDAQELLLIKKRLPSLTIISLANSKDYFSHLSTSTANNPLSPRSDIESDCLILFTSGTTALPKGARLTPLSLWADADQINDWLKITSKDRFYILLPLHHINSTTFSLATILAGGTILLSSRYSKSQFWHDMAQFQATISSIVPTIAYDLLTEQDAFNRLKPQLKQVSRIQLGSAPVQPTVVQDFYRQYHIRLIQGYGSTETSLRCTGVPINLSEADYLTMVEQNSIGTAMIHDQMAVLDPNGKKVAANQEGEICIRGPILMHGYLDNPQANKEAFKFGWFHSGDLGYWQQYNNRRFYFLKGRLKEIIIKGGVNISPVAVENAILKQFPSLTACYVVGFPHQRFGEDIGVIADGNPLNLSELQKAIHDRTIAGLKAYEQPAAMLAVDKNTLPMTSTGKVQRMEIKTKYAQKLSYEHKTVVQTADYRFRLISEDEIAILQQVVAIHNQRWPQPLHLTLALAQAQAKNGFTLGIFNHQEKLLGSISGLKIHYQSLLAQEAWTQTWNGITAQGSLTTHKPKGDCIVCVGITIAARPPSPLSPTLSSVFKPSVDEVMKYLHAGLDPVIHWHQQPKGGYSKGATILQILPQARPEDPEALGYCVLMEYPKLSQIPVINSNATAGTQLLEAALLYASRQHISKVLAYSRPSSLYDYLSPRAHDPRRDRKKQSKKKYQA